MTTLTAFSLFVDHCIIGSQGHSVVPIIDDALQAWVKHRNKPVQYLMKGQNCRVEMFSAMKADVIDDEDPSTGPNDAFLDLLKVSDRVSAFVCTVCAL